MYGDTTVIRRLARSLTEQAEDIRGEAGALISHAESVPWTGWAADAMRHRARDRSAALRRTAQSHDEAAHALHRHADKVDDLTQLIADLERRVRTLVSDARDRLADLGGVDDLLDRFVPPPPGHRDWLDVDLPGLGR